MVNLITGNVDSYQSGAAFRLSVFLVGYRLGFMCAKRVAEIPLSTAPVVEEDEVKNRKLCLSLKRRANVGKSSSAMPGKLRITGRRCARMAA